MPNNDNMPRGKYGDAEIPAAELAKAMKTQMRFSHKGKICIKKWKKVTRV